MSRRGYLLDENVDARLRGGLVRAAPEIVVHAVGDTGCPARGTPDPEILRWCEEHGFSLVTNNRSSMPVHLGEHLGAGRHIQGIFILNSNMSLRATIDQLRTLWELLASDDYADRVSYLPVTPRR